MAYSPTAHKDFVEKLTAWFKNQRIDVDVTSSFEEDNINRLPGENVNEHRKHYEEKENHDSNE